MKKQKMYRDDIYDITANIIVQSIDIEDILKAIKNREKTAEDEQGSEGLWDLAFEETISQLEMDMWGADEEAYSYYMSTAEDVYDILVANIDNYKAGRQPVLVESKTINEGGDNYWFQVMKEFNLSEEDIRKVASNYKKLLDKVYELREFASKNDLIAYSPMQFNLYTVIDNLTEVAKRINLQIETFKAFDLNKPKVEESVADNIQEESKKVEESADEYEADKYEGEEWGVFAKRSRAWVAFGTEEEMKAYAKRLNELDRSEKKVKPYSEKLEEDIIDAIHFFEGELDYLQEHFTEEDVTDKTHLHILDQIEQRGWGNKFQSAVSNKYWELENIPLEDALVNIVEWLESLIVKVEEGTKRTKKVKGAPIKENINAVGSEYFGEQATFLYVTNPNNPDDDILYEILITDVKGDDVFTIYFGDKGSRNLNQKALHEWIADELNDQRITGVHDGIKVLWTEFVHKSYQSFLNICYESADGEVYLDSLYRVEEDITDSFDPEDVKAMFKK